MSKELSVGDVKNIVNDEISRFVSNDLDKEVKKILHGQNNQSRAELVNMIKSSLEGVFKTLWVKRDFWKTDIK
jgi:hypothetical protein